MRNHLLGSVIASAIFLIYFPTVIAQEEPIKWYSIYSETAPSLDGNVEPLWNNAIPLTVIVKEAFGGIDPQEVVLRALHTDDSLYVVAQWADTTRSDMRDPYIWNPGRGEYERPTTPDDQFALEFPLEGELQISMLPEGKSYVADVWHWKAGRSNLGGWVDDKRHIISTEPVAGGLLYNLGGRAEIYVARPMDSGQASYTDIDTPEVYTADIVPSYSEQQPDGSQLDVRGKGIHDGTSWTLEMGRKFVTGNADDAILNPEQEIICAIAILDDELYWNHSVSQKLILSFKP